MKTTNLKQAKNYIILFLILLHLVGCNKEDNGFTPTLPEATTIGANTFGCYVDGILITPRDGTGTFGADDPGMQYWGSSNYPTNLLDVRNYKNGGRVQLHFYEIQENGEDTFPFKESNCQNYNTGNPNFSYNLRARLWDEPNQKYNWYCSIEDSGFLTITRYDLPNRILSGTFYCKAVNRDDNTDIIDITEGRFDIKWDILNNGEVSFP